MSDSSSHNGRKPRQLAPPTEYADVQKRSLLVDALALSSTLTLISTVIWPHVIWTLVLIAQLAAAVCFCTLFIRIKDGYLIWQFGTGWIRGKIALSEIESSRVVRSRLAYGWGFRRKKRGWSFNRSGALALEIFYGSGKRLRLGTPRADELRQMIENAPERKARECLC